MKTLTKTAISFLGLALSIAAYTCNAIGAPAEVLIIRHAEKPDNGPHLSPIGQQRAQALVGFFTSNPSVLEHGTPVAIYAAKPEKHDGSLRPMETIAPLAQELGLEVNSDFSKDEFKDLANEILDSAAFEGKTVLISWVHDTIPQLAHAFGIKPKPSDWPNESFDRVWKLEIVNGKAKSLIDLPQHVLPGDSSY
jgi:broad specificity phosphatase PhoE